MTWWTLVCSKGEFDGLVFSIPESSYVKDRTYEVIRNPVKLIYAPVSTDDAQKIVTAEVK